MPYTKVAALAAACAFALFASTPAAAVDLATAKPFQVQVNCAAITPHGCNGSWATPAGKIAVIEQVSVYCSFPGTSTRVLQWTMNTTVSGVASSSNISVAGPVFDGSSTTYQTTSQLVRLYSDPQKSVFVFGSFTGNTSQVSCVFTLSGELANIVP
ncbi:MAG: hypothetical protein JSR45_15295 [Proteobacteria bacterium]|nr:hypothetical protein [Pseudomonadota bacterium]